MKLHRAATTFSLTAALGLVASAGLVGCDVDVEEGEMPSVQVDPGESPDVDVAGPEIKTETREVEVPVGIEPAREGDAEAQDTD